MSLRDEVVAAKLDASGALTLVRAFGSPRLSSSSGIALRADGSVLLTGCFEGTLDFNVATLDATVVNYFDAFVAGLSAAGTPLFALDAGLASCGGSVVELADGRIVTSGYSDAPFSFANAAMFYDGPGYLAWLPTALGR